jgi:CRISPR/Cas system-associated endonuclease Cas3-HD
MIKDKENTEKKLTSNLDKFLNKNKNTECKNDECLINNPEEIVKREHKKIITNDGRQLLSEYTI